VSRRDDERVADILEAASQIREIIESGRDGWDKDRIRQLAWSACWRSSARLRAHSARSSAHDIPASRGATSSA
jgi:hypothetical protein